MFDIDRAIKLAKMNQDIRKQCNEMFNKPDGFINVNPETSQIHIQRDAFLKLFHGEYDRKGQINICGDYYWEFFADVDGVTFFCMNTKEDLNAE